MTVAVTLAGGNKFVTLMSVMCCTDDVILGIGIGIGIGYGIAAGQ